MVFINKIALVAWRIILEGDMVWQKNFKFFLNFMNS